MKPSKDRRQQDAQRLQFEIKKRKAETGGLLTPFGKDVSARALQRINLRQLKRVGAGMPLSAALREAGRKQRARASINHRASPPMTGPVGFFTRPKGKKQKKRQ